MKLIRVMGILIALALLFSLVPVAWAAEDSVTGSFSPTNVLPTVTGLNIYDITTKAIVADISPQVYYSVNVTAGDGNTIEDIDEIEVQLFLDVGDTDPLPPGAGSANSCAILTWDKDGGGSEWTIDAGGSISWSILTANCTKPSNMVAATGVWAFVIMAGKVATETQPTGDNWDTYAESIDGSGSGNMTTRDKEVWWYGEISTASTANFGGVENGSGFANDVNEVNNVSVNYISNGNYDQRVKSDATWAGGTYTATYDSTGVCANPQEFSLRAYDSDVFGSAVQVNTAGVSIDATGTLTSELGHDVTTNTLWLKIAMVFSNDTYSGNIVYIIADR
jgi:hypothetical protein